MNNLVCDIERYTRKGSSSKAEWKKQILSKREEIYDRLMDELSDDKRLNHELKLRVKDSKTKLACLNFVPRSLILAVISKAVTDSKAM